MAKKSTKKQERSVKQVRQEKREQQERELQKLEKKQAPKGEVRILNLPPKVFTLVAVALVVVIALLSVGTVLLIRAANPYRDTENPIAVFEMSDGKELVFELLMDEAPNAVTVFHYYAYHKYYNGTVIDALSATANGTRDSLKMGAYSQSRGVSTSIPVKMFEPESAFGGGQFTIFSKTDSAASSNTNEAGALSTIFLPSVNMASAEFQIGAAKEGAVGSGGNSGKVFGRAFNQSTLNNIRSYTELTTAAPGYIYVVPSAEVKIKKIKFYNNRELLKNVDFTTEFKNTYVSSTVRTVYM